MKMNYYAQAVKTLDSLRTPAGHELMTNNKQNVCSVSRTVISFIVHCTLAQHCLHTHLSCRRRLTTNKQSNTERDMEPTEHVS